MVEDKKAANKDYLLEETKELLGEEAIDEFSKYFKGEILPKIMVTSGIRPSKKTYAFLKEIVSMFPNCHFYPRKDFSIKKICALA